MERLFRDCGLSLDPALEIADNEARKLAAVEGLGVAVLSDHAVRAEVAAGLLVPLRAEGFPLRRDLALGLAAPPHIEVSRAEENPGSGGKLRDRQTATSRRHQLFGSEKVKSTRRPAGHKGGARLNGQGISG